MEGCGSPVCGDSNGEIGALPGGSGPIRVVAGPRSMSASGDWDPTASDRRSEIRERRPWRSGYPLGSSNQEEGAMSVVVGVDVGASKHVAAICRTDRQRAERRLLRYRNNRDGFNELDAWLQSQSAVERVVMESSGHYWLPLASHLRRAGVRVAVVNPLEAKYFAKSRLRRT